MSIREIWKKSKKTLAFILAVALFFGGWENYDFSVSAAQELEITLSYVKKFYTGREIELPEVTQVKKGQDFISAEECEISWTSNESGQTVTGNRVTEAGNYTVQVTKTETSESGEPADTLHGTATFEVARVNFSQCTVQVQDGTYTYTGDEIKPAVSVVINETNEVVAKDYYQVEYQDNIHAGTAKVLVKALAEHSHNVEGQKEATFTIGAKNLTSDMVTLSKNSGIVNGTDHKEQITVTVKDTVKNAEKVLEKDQDYTLDIPNMIDAGEYPVKVVGKTGSDYTGTVEKMFVLSYAEGGSVAVTGNTFRNNVYTGTVTAIPQTGFQIGETINGPWLDQIAYTSTPDDYVVYLQGADGSIQKVTMPSFKINNTQPTITLLGGPAEGWAKTKTIALAVTNEADIFYANTKVELGTLVNQQTNLEALGLTEVEGSSLIISENISTEKEYYFYAIDHAGHVAALGNPVKVNKVDVTAPTLSADEEMSCFASGVYWKGAQNLIINLSGSDAAGFSGMKSLVFSDTEGAVLTSEISGGILENASLEVSQAGTYTIIATDQAENTSYIAIVVKQDTKAPEVTLNEPTGENRYKDIEKNIYWFSGKNISIPFVVDDTENEGDTEKAPYHVYYSIDRDMEGKTELTASDLSVELQQDEKVTYYFQTEDIAGNKGEIKSITVAYDSKNPEISEAMLSQDADHNQWINFTESHAESSNQTFVEFSVKVDEDGLGSGVDKIEYSADGGQTWHEAQKSLDGGYYVFRTEEHYADGKNYQWQVKVTDHVQRVSEVCNLGGVQIDTTAPDKNAYLRLISDTVGENDTARGIVENGTWSSKIYSMLETTWNKIWGKQIVKFEVYVQDVTSGIAEISMSYNGTETLVLGPGNLVEGVQVFTDFTTGDGEEKEGYFVYEGQITLPSDEELVVNTFQIDRLTDQAGNVTNNVILGGVAGEDIIYLDNVAPELSSVTIDGDNVLEKDAYLYNEAKTVTLTIHERFFSEGKDPVVTLKGRESGTLDFAEVATEVSWNKETKQGTVKLPLCEGKEMEYQIQMTYADPSGNKLVNGENVLGVNDGTFVSKMFVIDDVAPELVSYRVTTTDCRIADASVLENKAEDNDLEVEFVLNDNPSYYANSDRYAASQDNLVVRVYKVGETDPVKIWKDDGENLQPTIEGRNLKYSFGFDGEDTDDFQTENEYYITISYADAVDHLLVDQEDLIAEGSLNDGTYTSENYIIDHVAPLVDVQYTKAVHVVKDGENASDEEKLISGYTAYYNDTVEVTLTVDEKYVHEIPEEEMIASLENFVLEMTKDGEPVDAPSVRWQKNGEKYQAVFEIEADKAEHRADGNYQFTVKYVDCSGNLMDASEASASNETKNTEGVYTSPILVMDTTAPVVKTSYTGTVSQVLDGRDYFNTDGVTFDISVTDRNIRYQELKDVLSGMTAKDVDETDVSNTALEEAVNAIAGNDTQCVDGTSVPEEWIIKLPLSTEANYVIPVSYTDLAGNHAEVTYFDPETNTDITVETDEYEENVTFDQTKISEDQIYVQFQGDINGKNILDQVKVSSEAEDNWISKIYQFVSNAWKKLWGKKEISFDVYVRDEISGSFELQMQYHENDENGEIKTYTFKNKDAENSNLDKSAAYLLISVENENRVATIVTEDTENAVPYVKYSGRIVIDDKEDLFVTQFEITSVSDKAKNELTNVNFKDSIYLDAVAPELSITIQDPDGSNPESNLVKDERYFYDHAKTLVLTVDERFFGAGEIEDNNYPDCTLYTTTTDVNNDVQELDKKIIDSNRNTWIKGEGNRYSLFINLDVVENKETEYRVELSYADPAENLLINAENMEGVDENGTFTSKIFVIDDLAPELVSYSVATTDCDVDQASVLENQSKENDLKVQFTINDNHTYYQRTDAHDYSQDYLQVSIYKAGENGTKDELIKTLKDHVEGSEKLKIESVEGREHTYSFEYDGELGTQNKFYVVAEYVDVVGHRMVGNFKDATPGSIKAGIYKSEDYIIDHVAPVFEVDYSDATNVVEGSRYHDADKKVDEGKQPLKGYTSYYNQDMKVTFTFDEKYVNVIDENGNLIDSTKESKDPLDHFTFTLKKNGKALAESELPEMTWSHDGTTHTAEFTITASADHKNDGDYQFVVKYQDCAGNQMKTESTSASNETEAKGTYVSPMLVMDTTAPVIEKVAYDTIDLFNTVKERDYVNKETNMTFTVKEHNPTPTSSYSITKEGNQTASWTIASDICTTTLKTVKMLNAKGDEQTVEMYIEDWAGNQAELKNADVLRSKKNTVFENGKFTDRFTVDTVLPTIQMEYLTYTPNRQNVNGIDYFKQGVSVKVTVDEHNFDQDLFEQTVIRTDRKVAYEETGWVTSGDIHEKVFTFTKDNQYDLSITGTDNAKNQLTWEGGKTSADMTANLANSTASVSVAVDSTIPAIGDTVKPIIVINPATAPGETIDGQALYHSDVTYEVVVYDPLVNDYASGIDNITFDLSGEDGTKAVCTVNKAGNITNHNGVTVQRVGGDVSKLAQGVENKYTFYVRISSDVFNTNGIILKVRAEDVATTKNEKQVKPIAIDITKPKVVVSYDNNDVSNEKYFHDIRIATVTVTERNFSNDCLQFIVNGSDKNLDFTLVNAGSGNRDDAVWVGRYTFPADSDYKVDVEVRDRAQNVGSVEYTGEAPQEFTIDMINPKITVEYDNNSYLNELYYKDARTATITIQEHNFSADDVKIELTAKDDGRSIENPSVSAWSSDGDYHHATIRYNYDGEFTFDIDFMDLATNEADDYEMEHFIVDLTAPELEIFDIENMSANNGVVQPAIRYYDTNYDAEGTQIIMTGYHNGVVEMTGERHLQANGLELKLKDFAYEQDMDDLYTMNAVVYDLAGNSSEETVMFSVNRFGSVYTFDQKTDELIGDQGKYYTNQEQDLTIIETNVDTLEFKEITCNLNGQLKTLKEGTDFTVGVDGSDATWKQYTYKINKENFVDEGTYILTIYSEDRATNTSDNNSKGKKIEFVVDKTNPSVLISGIENGGQYRTNSKEMTIDVEDNVRLSKVVVMINGEETVYDAAKLHEVDGKIVLNITDASQWQEIQVTVYDAAGNVQNSETMRVLVTANILVQWYRNTPVFYGSIGTSAAAVAGVWWFFFKRKKSK